MTLITIIGRGHSGTRAISHTLSESEVFMGEPLNKSGDLLPPQAMYEACRVMAPFVTWHEGLQWDFDQLHTMDIPAAFIYLLDNYLQSVHASLVVRQGWKIPETTLVFPWIVRLYPDIKYIYWVRNPLDSILGRHITDDLADFDIPYPETDSLLRRRAISWKYQYDLVKATPKPKNWLTVRFEDFILKQDETLAQLEDYLELKLAKIPVRPESVDRWKTAEQEEPFFFDFLTPAMQEFGYDIPTTT